MDPNLVLIGHHLNNTKGRSLFDVICRVLSLKPLAAFSQAIPPEFCVLRGNSPRRSGCHLQFEIDIKPPLFLIDGFRLV